MNSRKAAFILIISAAVLTAGVTVYGLVNKSKKNSSSEIEKYTIPSKNYVYINGVVKPKNIRVYESNPAKGKLDSVNVSDGQHVSAGTIVMSYRNQDVINQISELKYDISGLYTADANEKELRKKQKQKLETQRANMIVEAKAAGQPIQYSQLPSADLDTPPTDYASQIAKLQRQIDGLNSKAYEMDVCDISGTASVEDISGQDNGKRITVRSDKYIVEGTVKERDLKKIEEGMEAKSVFIADNKSYDSKIDKVEKIPTSSSVPETPAASGISGLGGLTSGGSSDANQSSEYKVVISVNSDADMIDGFHVQTKVNIDKDKDLKIPKTAVLNEKGNKYVYLISKGALKKKKVEIERYEGKYVYIESGLKENDVIAKKVNKDMKEGDKVE